MNRFRRIRHFHAISLIAGLLAAVWIGQTHAHFDEDPYEADSICAVCLASENVSHFLVTSTSERSGHAAVIEQTNAPTLPVSAFILTNYLSRAPPLTI